VNCIIDVSSYTIKVNGRGGGRFGAYSNTKPTFCRVDMKEEEFAYNDKNGLLTVKLECTGNLREIEFIY
jgi:raffinose synthase